MIKALAILEGELSNAGVLPPAGSGGVGFRRRTVAKYNSGLY